MKGHLQRLIYEIPCGQDWLREVRTDGIKNVETLTPPKHGQPPGYGKLYDTDKSRMMAEKMLSRPACAPRGRKQMHHVFIKNYDSSCPDTCWWCGKSKKEHEEKSSKEGDGNKREQKGG